MFQYKIWISYILLLDSLWGIILENNEWTYYMTLLISILLPLLILTTKNRIISEYIMWINIILYITFSTYNILIWYIGFELIIIPMIYLISKGSSGIIYRYRALYRFTLYTICGGLLLLISLSIIVLALGSYNYYILILNNILNYKIELILFPIMIISYFIKLPIIPFHIWLPDTHGEASTNGSVILAALLLKLGGIGIIRWLIPILPYGYLYYRPIIIIIGILSSIYASITTLRHIDIKKLIAYSSIGHMGFILINSLNKISLKGILLLLISHGFVSSLLFFIIGFLYIRTGTRILFYYKGINNTMPLFSIFLFFGIILNAAIPPSLSFFSEFLILQGSFNIDPFAISILLLSVLLSGVYNILLFSKISFSFYSINYSTDLNLREFYILLPLILLSFLFSFII